MAQRLSISQVDEIKQMVIKGVPPEDIAKHFNIAISSVHNYKARFKADGIKFPSVRGRRPQGKIPGVKSTPVGTKQTNGEVKQLTGVVNKPADDGFKFIINGVSVQISAEAKSVSIDKNKLEVRF